MNTTGNLRFRDFVFPVDPQIIKISSARNVFNETGAFSQPVIKDCGEMPLIISGEGEFFGESCVSDFDALKLRMEKPGVLAIPYRDLIYAYPEKLDIIFSDIPDVIRYRFSFIGRRLSDMPDKKSFIYSDGTVCLWDIADKYAADIDMLVNINPHISRPDRLIPENERINLW